MPVANFYRDGEILWLMGYYRVDLTPVRMRFLS
jgi:hypothetical protein